MKPIFISHSSKQRPLAEHLARFLERRQIACWLAPRDIPPGADFPDKIAQAIRQSAAIVLLFSADADASTHVGKELILADEIGKFVLPIRTEAVAPSRLSYQLADKQFFDWLDGRDETLEQVARMLHDFIDRPSASPDPARSRFRDDASPRYAPPERIVEAKLSEGAGFRIRRTIHTGHYHGPSLARTSVVESILNSVFASRKTDTTGYHVRNFDWEGQTLTRPCDTHLGFDEWDSMSGRHLRHGTASDESWATVYALRALGGVLFGNGRTIYFFDWRSEIEDVPGRCDADGFAVTKDRLTVAWFDPVARTVRLLSRPGNAQHMKEVSLGDIGKSSHDFQCHFPQTNNPRRELYCFQRQLGPSDLEPLPIVRIDVGTGRTAESCALPGLQNIGVSPDGSQMMAVTADAIHWLSLPGLTVVDSLPITDIRESDYSVQPPAHFSPCGRYAAYSVAMTGEVEVIDAKTRRRLARLKTGGLPTTAFEWSRDGGLLAAGVFFRSSARPKLMVWDIDNWRLALTVEGLRTYGSERNYTNRPRSFCWHPSSPEFAVLLEDGEIVQYVLDA